MTKKKSSEDLPPKSFKDVDTPDSLIEEVSPVALQKLQAELDEAKALASEHWEKLLRKEAEFQNFRKRAENDVANARKYGIERFAEDLLAVIDSFEQAQKSDLEADGAAGAMLEGMTLTYKVLLDVMVKFGIKPINPEGEIFNPEYHEAISMQESNEAKPNQVLVVVQKGFMVHERVLRPARVVVAKVASVKASEEK